MQKSGVEDVPFNAVAECKKVAFVMKTASGIKRFQDDNGYLAWFNQFFALVKTRDSCQPEQAIEPSAETNGVTSLESSSTSLGPSSPAHLAVIRSSQKTQYFFVPVKLCKKGKNEGMLQEVVEMIKKVVDQDPMKEFLQFAREEADKARKHELELVRLMVGDSQTQQRQIVYQNDPVQQGFYNYLQDHNNEKYINSEGKQQGFFNYLQNEKSEKYMNLEGKQFTKLFSKEHYSKSNVFLSFATLSRVSY